MKKEFIKIVLVASLALNLAFISAGIYRLAKIGKNVETQGSTPGGRYELSIDQQKKLDEVVKNFRIRLVENKSEVLEKRIDIVELLGDPDFKTETLEEKLLELNDIEGELNYEFVSTLLEISIVLDRGQWLTFLYNLSKGWFFSSSNK
ncbi:MAG: hypothetical protein KAS21_02405 [Candidatus Aminicenantes bacterium]|nr:hypothetical protein [Candidatus Aminicenantes bacterium]